MHTHHALTLGFFSLFPLLACGPDVPCREEDFQHGEHVPHAHVVERESEDGAAFEVVIRFNDAAAPLVDAFAADLRILSREELHEVIDRHPVPRDDDEDLPGTPEPLPVFSVTLVPKDPSVDADDYAFRASLTWLLPPDVSGPFKGMSAPRGFGVAGCREGLLQSSSLPHVHLAGVHSELGDTGSIVGLGKASVAFVTGEATTHIPVVANGFYFEPVLIELAYSC